MIALDVLSVLNKVSPFINKQAKRCVCSHVDVEDAVSHIQLGLIEALSKTEKFEGKSEKDIINMSMAIIRNKAVDLISASIKRKDTHLMGSNVSLNSDEGFTVAEDLSDVDHSPEEASAISTIKVLIRELKKDNQGEDLIKFLTACIAPDEKVLEEYRKWSSKSRTHSNASGIPPMIAGKAVGLSRNQVYRFQCKLMKVFHSLGYSLIDIYGTKFLKTVDESWFSRNYNTTREAEIETHRLSAWS